jgi:drug/metabolite transporter (DMT)-like permease
MARVFYLKLLYLVASALWLGYCAITFFGVPVAVRNPNLSGAVYCLLLIGILPTALGYFLLFKVLPWAGRSLRRA